MSERIQKFLSGLGYGSRREIEEWIIEGRLVVNGEAATIGLKVSEADAIKLDGKRLSLKAGNEPLRVLLYKKRTGEMVTREDPEGRRTVFRKLPELETGRWIAVGRLDVNTSGLLLMTNHGELARRLMHPSFEQRREYAVRALGEVQDDAFANLRKGVALDDGPASFESIRFGDNEVEDDEAEGEGGGRANHWFIVTITEGRHREVRRLFESQGLIVNRLIRTGYGPIKLGGGIKSGSYREATAEELRKLLDAVNLDAKELAPERVRESHRTKSDYTAQRAPAEEATATAPVKRGDSKKAHRAAALAKRETRSGHQAGGGKAGAWTRASKDERKIVERQERRSAKYGAPDESPVYRLKPAAAPGGSPWGKSRVEVVRDADGDEAPPQQFKAKGFGAKSERSYQERGDHAPAAPTRRYRDSARDERPRSRPDDQPKWGARDKPSASKPYGSRTSRDPAVFRPRGGDERPGFGERGGFKHKPAARPWGEKSGGDKPRTGKVWGETREGERPFRKPAGDKPAFRPAREGGRSERERPATSNAWSGKPAREGRGSRDGFETRGNRDGRGTDAGKPAFSPRKAAPGRPTQRFVVKDGAATRPGGGKPKLGLGARKKREIDE